MIRFRTGDVVVCVDNSEHPANGIVLKTNTPFRVSGVGTLTLVLEKFPGVAWMKERFRLSNRRTPARLV